MVAAHTKRLRTMYWIGTSGYSYPEWKGSFYPEDLSTGKMLGYYADRFSTVEINNNLLPDAQREGAVGLGRWYPRRLRLHAEGASTDHPPGAASRLRGPTSPPSARGPSSWESSLIPS